MDKVENFVRRLRWKAYFFLQPNKNKNNNENDDDDNSNNFNYGFKTDATPPQNEHLNAFENDLYEMIRRLEFKLNRNDFQKRLNDDMKKIRSNKNILVFADKSTNFYEMPKQQYEKLLNENITKSYKKSYPNVKKAIDKGNQRLAKTLDLDSKMECLASKDAFVTLKDHKEDFRINPKCRLINPAKSELGKVSKKRLERVVEEIQKTTNVNQWMNTSTVIEWFKKIPNKNRCKFIKFDIDNFYPSITEALLDKAILFAKGLTRVSRQDIEIIKQTRKSLLFSNDEVWVKKGDNELFDVTMGSFDGAEVCELVGLYLLDKLALLLGKENVGLYRDDGLAVVNFASGRKVDQLRKQIIAIFKNEGLQITINVNLSTVDFLDVTFDLASNRYYPFRKPDNDLLYINKNSNHPPTILKELPNMINKRISDLSCNEEEFKKSKTQYESALKRSGFITQMTFSNAKPTRQRYRKVIWFNPPYNQNVKTNIGRSFLRLIDKHFPRHHKLYKIFNRNTLKLSYSCTSNMENFVKQHNSHILKSESSTNSPLCNCRNKESCPLNEHCLSSCIVYKAVVTGNDTEKIYYGTSEGPFKERFTNHKKSFNNRQYQNDSELSKYLWDLSDKRLPHSVKWSIAAKTSPYKCGSRRCDLCITEKSIIVRADPDTLLNKRSELVSKCRHRNKFVLKNIR